MSEDQKELLRGILTRLDALLSVMKIAFRDNIEAAKERSLSRSDIKKSIYELCDGKNTVDEMARKLKKDPAYIRVYLGTLEEEGLIIREDRSYKAVV